MRGDLFIIVDLDRNRPITACLESRERAWEEAFDGILDYVACIRQSRRHGVMQDIEVKQVAQRTAHQVAEQRGAEGVISLTVAELAEAIAQAIVEYERKTLDEYQAC
jgi:hypothetical protein